MLEQPGGVVVDVQLASQLRRRNAVLGLRQQIDGEEPGGERELGGLEDVAGHQGDLAFAAVALEQAAGVQAAEARGTTDGAVEAVGSADADQCLLALGFGAVAVEEGLEAEAFLKLDLVLGYEVAGGSLQILINIASNSLSFKQLEQEKRILDPWLWWLRMRGLGRAAMKRRDQRTSHAAPALHWSDASYSTIGRSTLETLPRESGFRMSCDTADDPSPRLPRQPVSSSVCRTLKVSDR